MAGAVPSTFHQKIKFVVEENLITVAAKEDMIATTTVTTPNHDSRSKKIPLSALFDHSRLPQPQTQRVNQKR